MKTASVIIIFGIIFTGTVAAQDPAPILRRVFVASAESSVPAPDSLLLDLPQMLSSRLTSLNPIVIIDNREAAHSVITTAIEPAGREAVRVTIRLLEKEKMVRSSSVEFRKKPPPPLGVKKFIDDTARDFAPALRKVKPEVRLIAVSLDEKTQTKVEKIEFAEAMASRHELELWVGRIVKGKDPTGSATMAVNVTLPVMLTYTWFFSKYSGLSLHAFFEYSDIMAFSATNSGSGDVPQKSHNLFLLPGIGWSVRSLGHLSTTFSLDLLAGVVFLTAIDPLEDVHNLAPGETACVFYSTFSMNLAVCYNFTPGFSLRARTGFSINIPGLIAGLAKSGRGFLVDYDPEGAMLQYQLLSLGASLRF
jgi:hypothetical protein